MKNNKLLSLLNLKALTACVFMFCGLGAWGQTITTVVGTGFGAGMGPGAGDFSGDGAAAIAARLNGPYDMAFDASGNLTIADENNQRIRKVNAAGTIGTIAGSSSTPAYSGDGGPATAAYFFSPLDVCMDAGGNIYIADYSNWVVREINTGGIISTFAGHHMAGFCGDGGVATSACLDFPLDLAVDGAGNLYIADQYNNRIRMVNSAGIISTFAGNGTAGFGGDRGAATDAQINNPQGIAFDASGNLYIADWNNHRIRKVSTSGIITTIAGIGTAGDTGDGGDATAAELNFPHNVAVDPCGNIYFSETALNIIRKINTSGIITTFAGNGTIGYSGDGGDATAASLDNPAGITFDANGNVFIADYGNNVIRRVETLAGIVPATVSICNGSEITLTDATAGGTWSSNNITIATVGATTGIVTGVGPGVTTIQYTMPGGCHASATVTVNPLPDPITGLTTVCVGSTIALADATAGGNWTSDNLTIAIVGATTGIVTGVTAGTANIIYTIPGTGCSVSYEITVKPLPAPITGPTSVCVGSTITLAKLTTRVRKRLAPMGGLR